MSTNVIDLANDVGYERLASIVSSGSLPNVPLSLNIDALVEKQAYADPDSFADPYNKMFFIDTPIETHLSARYAEKCASALDSSVIDAINNACYMFGVPPINPEPEVVKEATWSDVLSNGEEPVIEAPTEQYKYAGANDYGTELRTCLSARAALFEEYAEDYDNLQKLASSVSPHEMVSVLQAYDERVGADVPWIQERVGSPEYAVFEKVASGVVIDLGDKKVGLEELAEYEGEINDLGVDIEFEEHDPYTIKHSIERLPTAMKTQISRIVN